MKTIDVKRVDFDEDYPHPDLISMRLDTIERHHVNQINWKEFDYKPQAEFSIAYSSKEILLKYYITESYFKAEKTESNQEVYEDSCVEFFAEPADDGIYYNLEFNGIGTCLLGSGTSRFDRRRADPSVIDIIRRKTSAGNLPLKERKSKFTWTITIAIPFKVFFHHKIESLNGRSLRANFYKCGDKLTVPHYLTWNPVGTVKPDFHRPEFFGILNFI